MSTFNNAADLQDRGFHLLDPPVLITNYDPAGDGDDRDAIVMVQREEWRRGELHDPDLAVEFIFRIMLARRLPPDMEFPEKLAMMLGAEKQMRRWKAMKKVSHYFLGVEQNGVGYAMSSSLRTKTPGVVLGYTTVANVKDKPFEEKHISMPRLAALDNMRVMLEIHRLKVARDCIGARELKGELNSFVWRGPGRPEAMEGQHDDLVMSLCGAVWLGTKIIPPVNRQVRIDPKSGIRSHRARQTGSIRIQ